MWHSRDKNKQERPHVKVDMDTDNLHIHVGHGGKRKKNDELKDSLCSAVSDVLHSAADGLRNVGKNAEPKHQAWAQGVADKIDARASQMRPNGNPTPNAEPPMQETADAFGGSKDSGKGRPHDKRSNERSRESIREWSRRQDDDLKREIAPMTVGEFIWFLLCVLILQIPMLVISILVALGPLVGLISQLIAAITSSSYVAMAAIGGSRDKDLHQQRMRGLRAEAAADWRSVSRRGRQILERVAPLWGLGSLMKGVGDRVHDMSQRYNEYVSRDVRPEHTPKDFRDDYLVVDQLPSGGSSARIYVVRKVDGPSDQLYVLKYFDLHDGSRLEAVMRESQSVEVAKRLNLIIDSHLGNTSFYYVMPYYQGDTLTKYVLDKVHDLPDGRAPQGQDQWLALCWVHQLLQLIAQYHEAGVIHKDIKPDNLIVRGEYLYLVDIGLLTPLESVQQLTTHGTEYFRDPEMVKLALAGKQVRDVDATKFDIYAVGAVLYFCFEGEFPTNGSLSRFRRDVPRAVQMVVSRALAPIERRYSDARQMLADVDALVYASSKGHLAEMRPADLPSFRSNANVEFVPAPPQVGPAFAVGYAPNQASHPPVMGFPQGWQPVQKKRSSFGMVGCLLLTLVLGILATGMLFMVGTAVHMEPSPMPVVEYGETAPYAEVVTYGPKSYQVTRRQNAVSNTSKAITKLGRITNVTPKPVGHFGAQASEIVIDDLSDHVMSLRSKYKSTLLDLETSYPVTVAAAPGSGEQAANYAKLLESALAQRTVAGIRYASRDILTQLEEAGVSPLHKAASAEGLTDRDNRILRSYLTYLNNMQSGKVVTARAQPTTPADPDEAPGEAVPDAAPAPAPRTAADPLDLPIVLMVDDAGVVQAVFPLIHASWDISAPKGE